MCTILLFSLKANVWFMDDHANNIHFYYLKNNLLRYYLDKLKQRMGKCFLRVYLNGNTGCLFEFLSFHCFSDRNDCFMNKDILAIRKFFPKDLSNYISFLIIFHSTVSKT